MLNYLAPDSVREIPTTFRGIYSHAVVIDAPKKLLLVSGQIGVGRDGQIAETFVGQCNQAMDNVEHILAEAGMALSDVLRVTYYVTDAGNLSVLSSLRRTRWQSENPPAITTLVVSALADQKLQVEIEVIAGH